MQIIPAINCQNFDCVKEKLQKAEDFLPADGWVQIDIADGKFTTHKTWNNPKELLMVNDQLSGVNIEVHLMVENPLEVIDDWVKSGVKRIIIHHEAVCDEAAHSNNNDETDIINFLLEKCVGYGVELGLAINPNKPVENIIRHLDRVRFIQLLAVNPGLAGQQFQATTLQKIKFLKENPYAEIIIEVDGGINLETAKLCKEAGADILASASHIWNSENQQAAFEELKNV
ncbi:MAG: hypothetical protein AAB405_01220 [Patescibacteria group bacterium]